MGKVAHYEDMVIPLLLARSMPNSYSKPRRPLDRSGRQQVAARVAEARGWSEPAAATFVNALLRIVHTAGPG